MTIPLLLCLALQQAAPLTPSEIDLLELPFKDGLFNPVKAGAQRVKVHLELRTCYGKKKPYDTRAWLIPAAPGRPARLVINNLQELAAPEETVPAPFPDPDWAAEGAMPSFADVGIFKSLGDAQTLVFAAWSRRLGRIEEAARLLRTVNAEKVVETFRTGYGWELLSDAVNAFMVAEDADALAATERLMKFPSSYRSQGEQMRTDLLRRREAGTFGKRAPSLPSDLRSRPMDERIAILIGALDQIENDLSRYGEMNLDRQPAARQLADCGEAAVPALLRCFESDDRLTRSIGVWREWSPNRTVLSVRAAAFQVLVAILRTDHWKSGQEPRWMDPDDSDGHQTWAKTLRAYWEKNGKIPFPERMMRVLRDPASTDKQRQEAAENLARLDRTARVDAWRCWQVTDDPLVHEPRPELAAFKDPTAAEAILDAMDRHMKSVASTGNWAEIAERDYLRYLGELGDRRIVPVLRKRLETAKESTTLRRVAFVLRRLGESGPLDDLARGLEKTPPPHPADAQEIIEFLGRGATPVCDAALSGIVRKDHPWHALTEESILGSIASDEPWAAHPYCLSLLRELLRDQEFTGAVVTIQGEFIERTGITWPYGFHYGRASQLPKERSVRAAERRCDLAGFKLSEFLPDAPRYHPLLANAPDRLRELSAYVDRHLGNFRRLTRSEMEERRLPWFNAYWVAR